MTNTDDVGKLFVGGLSWETTKEALQSYFSRFGEVVDSVVMKNNETGRSRGFGFVTFKDPSCVSTVLQMKPHELNGRTIDAKECTPRSMQKGDKYDSKSQNYQNKKGASQGKVFLGGLPPDITETDIRNALSRYGKVNHITIMCDQETKKCRGFGFLSFESEDSIQQACSQRFVNINGKQIECKRAEPRDNPRRPAGGQQYGMENGGPRQGAYGNAGGYQGGWNQPPQQYAMPAGQAYGNYQNYNAPQYTPNAAAAAMPYNAMAPAATPYAQPVYPNYAGTVGYGYQAPVAGYTQPAPTAYGQAPATQPPAYTQAPAAAPEAKTPNMGSGSYAQNAYVQNPPAYGPSKTYGSQAVPNGAGYNQTTAGAGRGQGYHPYRR